METAFKAALKNNICFIPCFNAFSSLPFLLYGCVHARAPMWRPKDDFQELVFSSVCVGSGDQTQVITSLDDKYIYPLNYLARPPNSYMRNGV